MAANRPAGTKADAAAPKVTVENTTAQGVEQNGEKLPLLEDVMQLARIDDVPAVKRLFDNGTVTADFKDSEGITPLHWAAINNRYAMCKFLIEKGCDVNAKGGEAVATPAMWAAQRCNYYIVHLLLENGADALLQDASGYNILHLATFDGNIFLLTMLLHQNIPVDVADPQGHTCLMWAAYKGYPQAVDLFLRWGASIDAVDENGFNGLHWALVRGSQPCIAKMLEYGADRFAATSDGKTPQTIATEMKTRNAFVRALRDGGYDEEGHTKQLPFLLGTLMRDKQLLTRGLFLYPFFILPIAMYILSGMVIFVGLPISLLFAYGSQWALGKVLSYAPPDQRHMHKTPFLAGVFAGSLFWVGLRWLLRIMPSTFSAHPFLNVLFGVFYALCTYFYSIAMIEDPGYVPKAAGRSQQKKVIEDLLSLWKFDEQNFCTSCMIRTPLRSKHCRRCKRCVAKHDHHCPWIYNCVGANNLRHFVLYIICLFIGIVLFIRLVLHHLESLPAPVNSECNILAKEICGVTLRDPFTVVLSVWTTLQLTWVTMLVVVQLTQISRATTTWENMHGHHETPSGAAGAITAALTAGSSSLEGAQLDPSGGAAAEQGHDGHGHGHGGHGHSHDKGCLSQWTKLLGLDTFFAIAFGGSKAMTQKKKARNPYSRGCVTNCKDFWLDPAPIFGKGQIGQGVLGGEVVNYARMYESPRMHMTTSRRNEGEGAAVYHNIAAEEEG